METFLTFELSIFMSKVAAEETEDGDEAQIAVIWDFEIIAGMAAAGCVVRPVEKTADDLVEMPRLAFKEVTCNCTEFPRVGNVIITTTQKEDTITELMESCDLDSDISSESSVESEEGEDVEEENDLEKASEANENGGSSGCSEKSKDLDLFTEVTRLKGSSYHPHFQQYLKRCKELLLKNERPAVRLHFEPANKRDENAIVVQAELVQATGGKEWQPIGYVPGPKVPKVTLAIRNNDIQMVTLKNVFYQYMPTIQQFRYFPSITATKLGKWPRNKQDYKYNEKI